MRDVWIERSDVNIELLDAQLRAAGRDLFYGFSAQRGGVTLYMSDDITTEQRGQLLEIARAHDATQLTPQQQADLVRDKVLEQGRADEVLDMTQYAASTPEIQALAQKIVWLEQELRDLRGI
jgi:hypothetical protein